MPGIALCQECIPAEDCTGREQVGFPVVALQGPYVQGIVPLYRSHSTHQARLALSEISLVVPQGPATHRHRGIRQVTACPGCAPGREDRTGKEGAEQEKESCRAPRGTLLHIPVSRLWAASPQASGERHGHFKSDLFLALDVLSSGEAKCQSEGQPHLGCREPGALAKPPQLPLQYRRQVLA